MNLLNVDFQELYQRHLRRHSQFGINVLHLVAVVGIYTALYGVAFSLPGAEWIVGSLLGAYFLVLAFNIPFLLLLVNAAVVGGLLAGFLTLPEIPVWVHIIAILALHRFQQFQHRIYNKELDMSGFTEKYRKGPALFFLLAVYELPILLNFLVFDRRKPAS
ncbi:MAG: hypothetical protein ACYTGL_17900 [Planctomycetota bacterium]|jgi:hypothetical protein